MKTRSFVHGTFVLGTLTLLAACGQNAAPQASAAVLNTQALAPQAITSLQPGTRYSFRVPASTNLYLSNVANTQTAAVKTVTPTGSTAFNSPEALATWKAAAGLADTSCITLFLTDGNAQALLATSTGTQVFYPGVYGTTNAQGTFCVRPGLDGSTDTISLESKSYPGRYVTHTASGVVGLQAASTSSLKQDASWVAVPGLFTANYPK